MVQRSCDIDIFLFRVSRVIGLGLAMNCDHVPGIKVDADHAWGFSGP